MLRWPLHWQILVAMVVGAGSGLLLNFTLSERTNEVTLPDNRRLETKDSTNLISIKLENKTVIVDHSGKEKSEPPHKEAYLSLSELKEKNPGAHELFQMHGRSWARWVGDGANSIGALFLRMLKMVAIPLIIVSLLTGVMGLASAGRLGRMFGQTFTYYMATSMLAILTGVILVNTIRPGDLMDNAHKPPAHEGAGGDLGTVLYQQVETLIPPNPIDAAAESQFLSIISFTIAFGIFAVLVGGKSLETLRDIARAGFDVMMAMTMAIIHLAPIGVLCLILYATATQGLDVFRTLGWYMLTVFCGLLFHAAVTMPLILYFVARRHPWHYAQAMSPALLTAFSSASSNATLPLTMTSASERAGISNRITSFVLPLGATINMDGTALYEVVAVLFIAQLEPGISLDFTQQIIVVITALLASIGAAGIPHAGLVMMVVILQAVGLPAEKVGLILAVDRILDMCRTGVNVWSDSCGTAVIARFNPDAPAPEPADPAPPDSTGPPAEPAAVPGRSSPDGAKSETGDGQQTPADEAADKPA